MKRSKREKKVISYLDIEASEEYSTDSVISISEEDVDGISSSTVVVERKTRDWGKFTDDLAQKYGAEEQSESDEIEPTTEKREAPQYSLLPDRRSPRLWIVRCVRGKEREICLKVIANVKEEAEIFSVLAKPDLLGYFYIEAFSRQAVIDSLASVRFVNKNKIAAVPLNEMVDVMSVKSVDVIRPNSYVRVRKGKYKNDVGQVIKAINSEIVKIRIVPRIDNIQRLFDECNFDEKLVQCKVIDARKAFIYKRELYVDGLLEKDVMVNSLYFDIDVSFEEAKLFEKKVRFNMNEKIRVKRGDLINLIGTIRNIERTEVEVDISGDIYRMNIDDVEKSYREGDEISCEGRNAVILKVTDGIVKFIYTDTFGQEGEVSIDEVEPPVHTNKYEIVKNMNILRTKRDSYLNCSVEVQSGDFKGHFGVVKDVFKNSCRILLDSNLKYINVDRNDLQLRDTGDLYDKGADNLSSYGKTPSFRGDSFPTHGMRYDGKTPTYRKDFGKTPSYRQDQVQGKTPNYRADFGKTPNYKNDFGKTPNYRNDFSKTPSHMSDMNKTPIYKQGQGFTPNRGGKYEYGKTPVYKADNEYTPMHMSQHGKTPTLKHDYSKTPNLNYENNISQRGEQGTDWIRDDVKLNILVLLDGKEHLVKEIYGNKYILESGQTSDKVTFVVPEKYDKVYAMEGPEKGFSGVMIGLENQQGLVRNDGGVCKNIDIVHLSKQSH